MDGWLILNYKGLNFYFFWIGAIIYERIGNYFWLACWFSFIWVCLGIWLISEVVDYIDARLNDDNDVLS